MTPARNCAGWMIAGALVCFSAAVARGQCCCVPIVPQQARQLPPVDLKGTIQAVGAGVIKLTDEKSESYLVKIDPRASRTECSGKAELAYLRPGVFLRLAGNLDKRGYMLGVSEVTVVTPSAIVQPGVHVDAPALADSDAEKPAGDERTSVVIGAIKLIKDRQMMVNVPGKSIRVELADDAEIKIDSPDYTLAEVGDEITVKGRLAQPPRAGQPGQVYGEELSIKLAKSREGPPAKGTAKKRPIKRPARSP